MSKNADRIVRRLGELKNQLPPSTTVEDLIEKAKRKQSKCHRRQIGVQIDPALWLEFRKIAIDMGASASDILEALVLEYLIHGRKEGEP